LPEQWPPGPRAQPAGRSDHPAGARGRVCKIQFSEERWGCNPQKLDCPDATPVSKPLVGTRARPPIWPISTNLSASARPATAISTSGYGIQRINFAVDGDGAQAPVGELHQVVLDPAPPAISATRKNAPKRERQKPIRARNARNILPVLYCVVFKERGVQYAQTARLELHDSTRAIPSNPPTRLPTWLNATSNSSNYWLIT
jgi:hypothetical protein